MQEIFLSKSGLIGLALPILLGGMIVCIMIHYIAAQKHSLLRGFILTLLICTFLIMFLPVAIGIAHTLSLSMGHFGYPFLDAYLLGTFFVIICTFLVAWRYTPTKQDT